VLTTRGRCVLGLGLGVYVAAWAFGSKPLYPVATGLLLVVALAWVWVRLANRPFQARRGWGDSEHVEGEDVPVVVELEASASVAPAAATLVERVGRLFSETGAHSHDGRRLLLRRPSGFELHGVRQYEQGESLRRVHWRSTARRGQLMVKEMEDAPRDEIAVLLDADAAAVVGGSFDVQVRAAGSIIDSYVRRGRRAVLVVNSERREVQQVHSVAADWRRALELLAA